MAGNVKLKYKGPNINAVPDPGLALGAPGSALPLLPPKNRKSPPVWKPLHNRLQHLPFYSLYILGRLVCVYTL